MKGILWFPNIKGHETIEWDEDDKSSLTKAKETFEEKLKEGWEAFKEVMKDGQKMWSKIDKFDSKIDRILLMPLTRKLAVGG